MAEEDKKYAYRSLVRDANGYMRVVLIDERTGQVVPDTDWGKYAIRGVEGSGDSTKSGNDKTTDTDEERVTGPGEEIGTGAFDISGGDNSDRGGPEGLEGVDENGDGIMEAYADPLTGERVIDNVPRGPDFMYDVQEKIGQIAQPIVDKVLDNRVTKGFRDTVVPSVKEFMINENARNQARNMEEATRAGRTTSVSSQVSGPDLNGMATKGVDEYDISREAQEIGVPAGPNDLTAAADYGFGPNATPGGTGVTSLTDVERGFGLNARESRVDPDTKEVQTEAYSVGPDGSYTSSRDAKQGEELERDLEQGAVENIASTVSKAQDRSFSELVGRQEGTTVGSGRGYDTSLGYGAFTGGPQSLTDKTMTEIDSMQTGMLGHPNNSFNSSALGQYQVTRENLREQQQQMGFGPQTTYNAPMQEQIKDRLATTKRGQSVFGPPKSATALQNEWAGLKSISPETILEAYEKEYGPQSIADRGIAPNDKPGSSRDFNPLGNDRVGGFGTGLTGGNLSSDKGLGGYSGQDATNTTPVGRDTSFGFTDLGLSDAKSVTTESVGPDRGGFGSFGPDTGGFSNLGSNNNDGNDTSGYGGWGGGDVDSDQNSGGDGSGRGGADSGGVSSSESAAAGGWGGDAGGEFGGSDSGGMSSSESAESEGFGSDPGGEFGGGGYW